MCVNNGLALQPAFRYMQAEGRPICVRAVRCLRTAVGTVGAVVRVENGPELCSPQKGFKPLAKHAELSWLFPEVTYGGECKLHWAFCKRTLLF